MSEGASQGRPRPEERTSRADERSREEVMT